MDQITFQLRQIARRMWFLPAAFSLFAVVTVLIAYYLARFAPEKLPFTMPSDAVVSILTILASSLLTVAVFALSTIVSALSSASTSSSPRAVPLIVGDRGAQTSISVFIGAFLYAIVGIIGLNSGIYSEAGRLFLFAVTIVVVVLVVGALIRWIGQISAIGRVQETIDRVEAATADAFGILARHHCFDCRIQQPEDLKGEPLMPHRIGYVQHLDAAQLQQLAEEHDLTIAVTARPGAFASPDRPLMLVSRLVDDALAADLAKAFTIGDMRTFDSDPRFGLVVLGEIASKALSPGINDAGTAIDVIGTIVRVLSEREAGATEAEVTHDRISVPLLEPMDLIEDAFRPIARDGAASIEVMQRLLAGLQTLSATSPELCEAALSMARDAVERARLALTASSDLRALEKSAAFAGGGGSEAA